MLYIWERPPKTDLGDKGPAAAAPVTSDYVVRQQNWRRYWKVSLLLHTCNGMVNARLTWHDEGLIQVHCLCCSQSERITISCRSRAVSLVCSYFLYVYCICVYILNIDIRHTYIQYVNTYVHMYVYMNTHVLFCCGCIISTIHSGQG